MPDRHVPESVAKTGRALQRWTTVFIAAAILLGVALGVALYLYVNGRLHSLEVDRQSRTAQRDNEAAAFSAKLDILRDELCAVVADIPPGKSPRIDTLRQQLACKPYRDPTPSPSAVPTNP